MFSSTVIEEKDFIQERTGQYNSSDAITYVKFLLRLLLKQNLDQSTTDPFHYYTLIGRWPFSLPFGFPGCGLYRHLIGRLMFL